jgi:hypothetical protein
MEHMEGEPNSRKLAVQQLRDAGCPKYAVFLRSPSGTRAHFKYLHDSIESATERCREYAADMASRGHVDYTYYAVEIKHRVGIEGGKIVDAPVN